MKWTKALKAGFITGLISAGFSTLLITLGARRIGRDPKTDWMEVGTFFRGKHNVKVRPGLREILTGITVHQWADLTWATIFFPTVIESLPRRWQKQVLLLTAVPWAILSSAIEYFVIIPRTQSIITMQVPYWTALTVHLSSAAAYPLYFAVRTAVTDHSDKKLVNLSQKTALVLGGLLTLLGAWNLLCRQREWPPMLASGEHRQHSKRFLRHMTWHHEVGVRMAETAVIKSVRQDLRILAKLMLAEHRQQLDIMRHWWQSWVAEPMAPLTATEYEQMAGMPDPAELTEMEQREGCAFEQSFLDLMIFHHEGAITMSDRLWQHKGDPRVLLLADAIRHSQTNQIKRMRELQTIPLQIYTSD